MDTLYNQKIITNKIKSYKTFKKVVLLQSIGSILLAGIDINANAAAPVINPVYINGVQADGGQNIGMSRSGRYIISAKSPSLHIFDLETQTSSAITDRTLSYSG